MATPDVRTLDLRSEPDADLTAVAEHLREDGVIACGTETVYGFSTACTPTGVERVRALKSREAGKPLIALVDSADAVAALRWTDVARDFAEIFWPGAVTLVLADPEGMFPPGVRSAAGTVAVRVSPHPTIRRLLAAYGQPITSTSVNEPGGRPARSGEEAAAVIRRLEGEDVWLLDEGHLPESGPSTIIDCTGDAPRVLREGTVPVGRLRCVTTELHGPES